MDVDKAEIFIATQSMSMANGAVQQQDQAAAPATPMPAQESSLEGMMGGMV